MTKQFEFKVLDNEILADGDTLSHRMMMKDSTHDAAAIKTALDVTQVVKVRDAAILDAASKPGFRYSGAVTDAQKARAQARDALYEASDREVSNAWRRQDTVAQADAFDPRTAWHDARANRTTDTNDPAKIKIWLC
jgi:hypothetical protein